jgi:hypothetical protein
MYAHIRTCTFHMDTQVAQADQAAQVDQEDPADLVDQVAQVHTIAYFVKLHNYVTVIPGFENVPTSQLPSGAVGGPGGPGGHGGPGAQL